VQSKRSRGLIAAFVMALFYGAFAAKSAAVVLDWDSVTWSPGANSNSFDIDPLRAGNDITVTFTGAVNKFRNDPATGLATPAINRSLEGGLSPVESSLNLGVDFHNNNTITCTVNFSDPNTAGVQNVSFSIFGIDYLSNGSTSFQDQIISISATSIDGVTQIAPIISNIGAAVTPGGTGLNQTLTGNSTVPDTGAGSGAGNVTISFGSASIQSFTFTYADGLGSKPNPTFQNISIGDITFTPVPEINPTFSASLSCLIAVALTVAAPGAAAIATVLAPQAG
jgi:hypothetical protein